MTDQRLSAFVATILRAKRIRFGDVRRLSRDVLPRGIGDRATAETLLALDRAIDRSDPAWIDYLAGAIRDFAATDSGQGGWLTEALGARPTKAGRAIERELALAQGFLEHARNPGQGMTTPDDPGDGPIAPEVGAEIAA